MTDQVSAGCTTNEQKCCHCNLRLGRYFVNISPSFPRANKNSPLFPITSTFVKIYSILLKSGICHPGGFYLRCATFLTLKKFFIFHISHFHFSHFSLSQKFSYFSFSFFHISHSQEIVHISHFNLSYFLIFKSCKWSELVLDSILILKRCIKFRNL